MDKYRITIEGRLNGGYVIQAWARGNDRYPIEMDFAATYEFANAIAWRMEREFNGAEYIPAL